VLELREVLRYGTDSFGDADHVSVYGMRPTDWYAAGVRLLGRTAVECTRDVLAGAIAADIAAVAASTSSASRALVVDPSAGSGNTLYWILHRLPGAHGVGFESDSGVFQLTRRNLDAVSSPIEYVDTDYLVGLRSVAVSADQLLIAFLTPPWGDALDPSSGLDLRRTTPPITEVVDVLIHCFPQDRLLVAVQLYEHTDSVSLTELKSRFDWSTLRIYDLNRAGENHALLLGTREWTP
jgi:hypothetical protein